TEADVEGFDRRRVITQNDDGADHSEDYMEDVVGGRAASRTFMGRDDESEKPDESQRRGKYRQNEKVQVIENHRGDPFNEFSMRLRIIKELAHAKQFHLEDEGRVGGDFPQVARPVAEFGRDGQLSFATDFHGHHALVPTSNHAPEADWELKRLASIQGAVELRPVFKPAGVMDCDGPSRRRTFAGSNDFINIFQTALGPYFLARCRPILPEDVASYDPQSYE